MQSISLRNTCNLTIADANLPDIIQHYMSMYCNSVLHIKITNLHSKKSIESSVMACCASY